MPAVCEPFFSQPLLVYRPWGFQQEKLCSPSGSEALKSWCPQGRARSEGSEKAPFLLLPTGIGGGLLAQHSGFCLRPPCVTLCVLSSPYEDTNHWTSGPS